MQESCCSSVDCFGEQELEETHSIYLIIHCCRKLDTICVSAQGLRLYSLDEVLCDACDYLTHYHSIEAMLAHVYSQ
jgi:hypothetical protein